MERSAKPATAQSPIQQQVAAKLAPPLRQPDAKPIAGAPTGNAPSPADVKMSMTSPAVKPVRPAVADNSSATLQLLDLEAQARDAKSVKELAIAIANETRKLTRARQIFVCTYPSKGAPAVIAVTGLAHVDRNTPMIQWLERTLGRAGADTNLGEVREFILHAYADDDDETAKSYPFREALWFPLLRRDGARFGGVLLTRETSWLEYEHVLARRLSATFSHAWSALTRDIPGKKHKGLVRIKVLLVAAVTAGISVIPVSMSTLAPFEVSARDAFLVTAPLDGVISEVLVPANTAVKEGDPLINFVDTTLVSRVDVAEREAKVAEAKVRQASLDAFKDSRGRYEAGILRSELAVKTSELAHARELLARSKITAAKRGIAVYGDKRELIGRPVSVGERLMEIADPAKVELRIDIPVADSIILDTGAEVKAFFDADPLRPLRAVVTRADYQAKVREGGTLGFRVVAELDDTSRLVPRLGVRGTAQVYGKKVPFIYYLLRRPISKVRQWTGL